MRGLPSSMILFFFGFILIIELVSYWGIHDILKNWTRKSRTAVLVVYGFLSLMIFLLVLYAFSNPELIRKSQNYSFFRLVILFSILSFVPKTFFSFFVLMANLGKYFGGFRTKQVILSGAALISCGIFLSILLGNLLGAKLVRTERITLQIDALPTQLEGLKIVQISDIHLGSFDGNLSVLNQTQHLIDQISPDLILFTGDIVNNFADEMNGYLPYLSSQRARYGKFAITGNHDYGDYSNWPDSLAKANNLDRIRKNLINSGFELLLNDWKKITVKDSSMYIIGVENWGHPPFPQYARLNEAIKGIPENSFRILLSHDPAHWEAEVLVKSDIPLTLSGHTHGAQFGFRIAGIEFSPMYFIQKFWGGLYTSGDQHLYVNRGLGTVGFPGRIDMRPEITLITLTGSKNH